METLMGYWRRFVVSVIGLKNRYWSDPFIKSEVNIVALQLLFALSLFIIASIFFNYIYRDVLKMVIVGVMEGIASGSTNDDHITSSLQILKSNFPRSSLRAGAL